MVRISLILLLAAACVFAQTTRTATLVGNVTDPTGAAIVGAKVTVVNPATGFTSTGEANELGRYYVPNLSPGSYEMNVEAQGFRTHVRKGIELRAGEVPRVDVQMELGAITESVTITGGVPLLETETSTAGATLENKTFMRIPIMQMRTYNIMNYLPGLNTTGFNDFHAVGQRVNAMGYTVDGVSAREPVRGTAVSHDRTVQTSTDALAEVKMLTTGIPAEYGRAGSGMITAVFKSGTNELHGSAEDRWMAKDFLHRGYFDKLKRTEPLLYHELAFNLGGPILLPKIYDGRNKTFFFFSWQRHHEKASETEIRDVPSEQMLNGDFSFDGKGFPIYDPASTRLENGVWVRDVFPANQVPRARFDPVAMNFLSKQPWATPNNAGFVDAFGPHQNVASQTRYRSYRSRVDVKLDHQFSPMHKIFGRWSYNRHRHWSNRSYTHLNWQLLIPEAQPHPANQYNAVVSDTYTFNPTTINEIRLGFNRRYYTYTGMGYQQDWGTQLGMPNVLPDHVPRFENLGNSGYAYNPHSFLQTVGEDFTLSENLTKVTGPHTLKFGYEVFHSRYNSRVEDWPSGQYYMGGTSFPFKPNTGHGFAGFLLGAVERASFTQTRTNWLPRWWTHAWYVQTDWKPTRNLTVNAGVRWTYESPFRTKFGQQSQFDPTVVDPITGKMGAITHPTGALAEKDLNNFQPRLGMAWNFHPKWVFRGSFGINTIDVLSPTENIAFEEYFASAQVQPPPGDPRVAFYLSQGPPDIPFQVNADGTVPFVGTNYGGRGATWYDPSMRMPYIASWSGGFQWQFTGTWLAEAIYQGSSGVGLLNNWDINVIPLNISTDISELDKIYSRTQNYKPYTQFGAIRHYSNYGHSSYHGITFRAEKRYSHGVSLNAFYTFSKALNNGDGDEGMSGITYYDRSLEKGRAFFDVTHRTVAIVAWDLPVGRGRRYMNRGGIVDTLLGGWGLTWVNSLQSGRTFTVSFAGSPNRYLPGNSRPNILLPFDQTQVDGWKIGPHRFPTDAQNPFLNLNAFAYPAPYTAGTLGRNTFEGPGLYWPQASLAKRWQYRERLSFTLRWDVSNVFKLPQFSTPNSTYNSKSLGTFARFTTGEVGGFAAIGTKFHHILVFRLQW